MKSLDLMKSYEFFKPESVRERVHIIGCGSVGSTIAELLVRLGLTNITLYDCDVVEPRNLANQIFYQDHIGLRKIDALSNILLAINPEIKDNLKLDYNRYDNQNISGYVFLCVDNIETRKDIISINKNNLYIKAIFDFRTRLTDAQHYAADWSNEIMVEDFINSMQFTHEEALQETPVSACNITLSVAPTIKLICSLGITNFINFVHNEKIKKFIQY